MFETSDIQPEELGENERNIPPVRVGLIKDNVHFYSERAEYQTPLENPFVLELLSWLGFDTAEEFLEK